MNNNAVREAILDIVRKDILLEKNLYKSRQIHSLYESKYNIDADDFESDTLEYQYYLDAISEENKEEEYLEWALNNISKVMSNKIFYKSSDFNKKCTCFGDASCTGNANNWIALDLNPLYGTNEGDLLNKIICKYLPKQAAKRGLVCTFSEYWSDDLIWNLSRRTNGDNDALEVARKFYEQTHEE